MLINLLIWVYISSICFIWGDLFLALIRKQTKEAFNLEVSLTCLIGLALIGTAALWLSIFIPLGWMAHSIIALPAIYYCLNPNKRNAVSVRMRTLIHGLSPFGYALLSMCVLMVLSISSTWIIHPDSIFYHAQSIQWFQKYKVVHGTVHIMRQLGFQSLWFASEAIFNSCPFFPRGSFPLGGAVLFWYFNFIVSKADRLGGKNKAGDQRSTISSWGWLFLLTFTIISWTRVRMTAASASPDFIVTVYVLAGFYLFNQYKSSFDRNKSNLIIALLFCATAFAIKLSAIPILLLAITIFLLLMKQRSSTVAIASCVVALVILPVLIRNVMVSGYLLFPTTFGNFFSVDWKPSISSLEKLQDFITAYARFPVSETNVDENLQIPFLEWTEKWWHHLLFPDKFLLIAIGTGAILDLVFLKQVIQKMSTGFLINLIIALAGSFIWFMKAPDPRFESGFLIMMVYVLYFPLTEKLPMPRAGAAAVKSAFVLLTISILMYTTHRFIYFFSPSQILFPAGIAQTKNHPFERKKLIFYMTEGEKPCGTTPVPCISDTSIQIIPRGQSINDGFRSGY